MKIQSQPALQPFQRSLRQQLVDAIGGEIVGGTLQPGDSLPSEDVLLARYGVSRTVLREALNVLFGKGLLDARPKRGTIVRPRADWNQLDPAVLSWLSTGEGAGPEGRDNLDDLMEIRRIIEPSAVALAAQRSTPEDIQRIADAYEAMERAGNDAEAFMQADLAFHIACLHAAHNDFLLPIANAIRATMMTSLQVTNRDPKQNRLALPLHQTILAAVRGGDAKAAAQAMENHLDDTQVRRMAAGRRPKPDHAAP